MRISSIISSCVTSHNSGSQYASRGIGFRWLFLWALLLCYPSFGQQTVTYDYDTAGNRIERSWSRGGIFNEQASESLNTITIPLSIDTLAPRTVRGKVSLDPNNLPLVLSEDEKAWLNDEHVRAQQEEELAWWNSPEEKFPNYRSGDYSVGAIPLQEGISPSGARTYNIPIPTASGFKLVPSVSLGYNSQAAEGWAGYGWDIQGISCIKLINKNEYYHGEIKAASVNASDPVFALDGIPLVTNSHPETSSAYPLETARGHILAAPEYNSHNKVCRFTVLYPNGIRAVYGRSHSYLYNFVFYYLSEMQDLEGNKITFNYTLDTIAGHDIISTIRYGYDSSDNYSGEIVFSYDTWSNCPSRYFAGKEIKFSKRLASIESRTDGNVIARYDFSYIMSGPLCLLNHIDCSSDNTNLPPLNFTYPTVPASQYLKKDNQSITLTQSFFPPDSIVVYKRGKFYSGEYRDGLLIYPGYRPYLQLGGDPQNGYYYGSEFNQNQAIIFIPRLEAGSQSSVDYTHLTCGSGFQTIDAVDLDGDGVDEIVRLNTTIVQQYAGKTKLSITVYRRNSSGVPTEDYSFYVFLNGEIGTRTYRSPYNRAYRWGDFNGDGKMELLAVAYSSNYNTQLDSLGHSYPQVCYTALIDMEAQSVLSDEVLSNTFKYKIDKPNCLIVNDIDNDGRSELCLAEENAFTIYRLQNNGHFALESSLSSPKEDILGNLNRPCYLADFNGDGYLDIARSPATASSSIWTIYSYTGITFSTRTVSIAQQSSYDNVIFLDVNRDGMADMVTTKKDITVTPHVIRLGTYINYNGYSFSTYQLSPSTLTDTKGIVPENLSAYNKPSAFMKFDGLTAYNYSYYGITGASRHVTRVKDSYGKFHNSGYIYLPSMSSSWRDTTLTVNNSLGYKFYTLPIYVLSLENHYLTESQAQSYGSMTYEYYNGVLHSRGLGFCGFSRIRTKEMFGPATFAVKDVADVYYTPEKMGVINKVVRKKGTGQDDPAYYTQTNTWSNDIFDPHITESLEVDALTGIRTQSGYIYDTLDYRTETRIMRRFTGSLFQYDWHRVTYQHNNNPTKYVLGAITEESIVQDRDGDTEYQWKNKTVTVLDSLFRKVSQKQYRGKCYCPSVNPYYEAHDYTLLLGETRWTYDAHGNVTSEKSAPYNATEFIGHTYTYDANGRYLLTDTDELGHTTTYVNYNKFGKPGRVDDYRSRNTYYSYDAWGNVTTVRRIDGSIESTTRAWGGEGAYTVTRSEAYGGPSSVSHFDGLGREIRRGVKRFDGQWQYTDTQYDKFGRINKTSLPFRGTAPTYWNTYTYDTYDRPIKILEPSGRETTWSYSGTSVTTVKDGIISTSTKDASGDVVSVQDAGGTITYTLRDDAQPSRITAPGNVETGFAYDNYGRRTSITDPSAGIRTESYVWNADGSHQQTHTGPHGSITTAWDKYGRITSVQRPVEFNTTYTYNYYGLLSSEQSTNSTGTEYTYDSYDRVSTVKETVPDSKWLKKTYTYGSWGNLSTVKYTTQNGDITTETYNYANGNNTGISITDGTTVWSLVSENNFGTPTGITTGTISREYGFTDFGMPTYRKMAGGNLQNYTYQFNASNGNLNSRADIINNKTESFEYDQLNRLEFYSGIHLYYENNGNLLTRGGVGSIAYGNASKPYQATSLTPASSTLVPNRTQEITYSGLDRPSILEEGSKTAVFTYNAAGERVKMQVTDGLTQELTRYYIGGQYECDVTSSGTKERLYLGGDAYSAPMVYQRVNNGSWTAYNIGRDYLGSVTHIATTSGTLVAEYSYDPWGRLRNPATQAIYTPGTEPALFLGRGYTGHEHLTWFGLINMNARLYDPLLGRFLSPDPYVQAPDFTQNFNRYSYALNNPLKYTDKKGQAFEGSIFTFLLQLPVAIFGGVIMPFFIGMYDPAAAGDWASEIWTDFGDRMWNAIKIDLGQFAFNPDVSFGENVLSVLSRFVWETPQMILGNGFSHLRNNFDKVDVSFRNGSTVVNVDNERNISWGMTLGPYINGENIYEAKDMFEHEYGHTIQSRILGPFFLPVVAIPSFIGQGIENINPSGHEHGREWYEVWSNQLSYGYYKEHGYTEIVDGWRNDYLLEQNLDWYFSATAVYYTLLAFAAAILIF